MPPNLDPLEVFRTAMGEGACAAPRPRHTSPAGPHGRVETLIVVPRQPTPSGEQPKTPWHQPEPSRAHRPDWLTIGVVLAVAGVLTARLVYLAAAGG